MHELTTDEARELVADLQQRRCGGDDDLTLITYLCNRYRIGKNDARQIYESFYRGFQHGADGVLGLDSREQPGADNDVVFQAASEMSVGFTQNIIEDRRRSASGCRRQCLLILFAFLLILRVLLA